MFSRTAFIADMIAEDVLEFGDFTLKSGRQSPYFFNLGKISRGEALNNLGYAYAKCIFELNLRPNVLFGPAYKGISLVTAAAMNLATMGLDVNISFNRKEAKGHGEGGVLVGGSLREAAVLVIDDVITDGASKIEACRLIEENGGTPMGILVALDRMEYDMSGERTQLEVLEEKLGIPIYSVATVEDVIAQLERDDTLSQFQAQLLNYAQENCLLEV